MTTTTPEKVEKQADRYIQSVGRRKTSTARARLTPANKITVSVNDKTLEEYFKTPELQAIAMESLKNCGEELKFKITITTKGGGIHSQSEAVRHAIARALNEFDINLRGTLKKAGYLTRDSRMKERRKFGLKKARKAPQWSKR